MAQYDVDLREYWRIIQKRKWIILMMTILVGISSYALSKLKEPRPLYRAEASVKIEDNDNMAFVQSGGFWVQTESMETHAYTITSFPVLKVAAVELGWIPKGISDERMWGESTHAAIMNRLKSMISTQINKGTNIIDIQIVSSQAGEAASVANTLARAYQDFNVDKKSKKASEVQKMIKEQLELTGERLKTAEQALRDFKERNGMISVDQKTREINDELASANREYDQINELKTTLFNQLKQLDSERADGMGAFTAKQLTFTREESPLYRLQARLEQLLMNRQNLLSKYTEKHPAVQEVENQIQTIIKDAKSDYEMYLEGLEIKEAALQERMEKLKAESRDLPEKEHEMARLQKQVDLQETLYSKLQQKQQEVLIQQSGKTEFISLVKPAAIPLNPFNIPSKIIILFTGLLMGLILGLVFGFGIEMFDTSMGTIEDVENLLQVPVLGIIPHLGSEDKGKRKNDGQSADIERARDMITHYDPKSLPAEAFRSMRTNLQFIGFEKKNKTFLITSAFVKEGKTLNSVNLALSLAQTGEKVLLVEADLRRSMLFKIFGLPRSPGLTDFVLGEYQWRETVNTITDVMLGDFEIEDILKTPGLDNLHIITCGPRPPNPTDILNSDRFRRFLAEAREFYDYILIDSPPILPVADPCEIAPYVDGVILVYMVGRIGRVVLKRAKATLDHIDARVVGVILNNVKPEIGPDYFKYHTYYYYGPDKAAGSRQHASGVRKLFAKAV